MNVQVGKTYAVNHSRKGKFVLHVDGISSEWVHGKIVSGAAYSITCDDYIAGDDITINSRLASFEEVN